ncbi:MAG TPA: OmpA family protein [Alphaproteobacteria bacterium]|nr:OmpA family protein [Alphaproteobacteria bacterium]
MKKLMIYSLVSAIALAGCQTTNPYTGEQQTSKATWGAGIGALTGAAIGALTNTNSGKQAARNAMIGAGIGALAGGGIGAYMDQQDAELRQQLQSTGVSVTRGPGGEIILNMPSDITFDLDRADVQAGFYPVLNSVAKVLKHYDKTIVSVDGYTDTSGSTEHNKVLSQQRAESVASYLQGQGVQPQRFSVNGWGETNLKVPTADGVKNAANRRVTITLTPLTA